MVKGLSLIHVYYKPYLKRTLYEYIHVYSLMKGRLIERVFARGITVRHVLVAIIALLSG